MKLTAKQRGEISGVLAMGGTRATAAHFVGCPLSTLLRAEQADADFATELRKAEGRAEMLQLKNIAEVARERQDWRASAWMLERRYPERYLRRRPDSARLKWLTDTLNLFVELIVAEIDDRPLRERILQRLQEVVEQFTPRGKQAKEAT